VANESANTFERHLGDANKALEVGAVSLFEVIRAQTELKTREADLARALTGNDVATLNLRRLMGLEGDGPLYLEPDWFTAALPSEEMEAIVAEALEKRPELGALDKGIEAAQEQVKIREAGKKPTIGALAQYQHIEGGSDIVPKGFIATGVMRWDFYTGGRTKAEIVEAESQVRQLQHQRHDLEEAVKLDVRAAFLQANEAAQRILMQFTTVQLAQQGQELADLRFSQGAGTQTETLDADLALSTARTGLVQALGDYFLAQADLAKASGRGWQPSTVGAPPGEAEATQEPAAEKQ
jgi:outer membrane protein TolC